MTTTTVRERPILMSAPMVRAILSGAKTQTRRAIRPQPYKVEPPDDGCGWRWEFSRDGRGYAWNTSAPGLATGMQGHCPYGLPGDRLWVREAAYISPPRFCDPDDASHVDDRGMSRIVGYAASMGGDAVRLATDYGVRKTPSIHMPRWASRITLEITGVRVERLAEISEEDARAEGVRSAFDALGGRAFDNFQAEWCRWSKRLDPTASFATDRGMFAAFWQRINGKSHPWVGNPFVWVVEFRRLEASQ